MNMKNINLLRKISYYKLKAKYYELLSNREIEFSCLNENYQMAKNISSTYFTEDGHDMENLKIYDCEIQALKYCLKNIKECKRLDNEINDYNIKMLKAEKKYNTKDIYQLNNDINIPNKIIEETEKLLSDTYQLILKMKEN